MWGEKNKTRAPLVIFLPVRVGGGMIVTVAHRGGNLPAGRARGDKSRRIDWAIRKRIADQDHRQRDARTHVLRPLEGYRGKAQQVTGMIACLLAWFFFCCFPSWDFFPSCNFLYGGIIFDRVFVFFPHIFLFFINHGSRGGFYGGGVCDPGEAAAIMYIFVEAFLLRDSEGTGTFVTVSRRNRWDHFG